MAASPAVLLGDDRGHVLGADTVEVDVQLLLRRPDRRAPRRWERFCVGRVTGEPVMTAAAS
jgi:hypothetical protein